jgi:hypothetical protein
VGCGAWCRVFVPGTFFCKILQLNDLAKMVLKTMDLAPVQFRHSWNTGRAPLLQKVFPEPNDFCKVLYSRGLESMILKTMDLASIFSCTGVGPFHYARKRGNDLQSGWEFFGVE